MSCLSSGKKSTVFIVRSIWGFAAQANYPHLRRITRMYIYKARSNWDENHA